MHANLYRHRLLPLVAPAVGVVEEPWVDRWFTVRDALGIKPPPSHALMPAPASDGGATRQRSDLFQLQRLGLGCESFCMEPRSNCRKGDSQRTA